MESTSSYYPVPDFRSYALLMVSLLLVAFGFRYAKELIALGLDKLYDLFIEHHVFQP